MRFHKFTLVSLFVLSVGFHAEGQIKLQSRLSYTTYAQYEPVLVETTVKNELGQAAVFNDEPGDPRFYYTVRDENGFMVPFREESEQPHPQMIPPRSSETITNNILRYFEIRNPGYYSVQPSVDWRNKTYRGEKKQFEVVKAREVQRAAGVVPGDESTRLYRLLHINRNQQDHLLLRIDDEEAHLCYGVFPLGRTIISSKPNLAVDADAKVHVVFRTAPHAHMYATYSPMGYLLGSQIFGEQYADIQLLGRPDGSIFASGTIEERKGNDIPFVESIIEKNKR